MPNFVKNIIFYRNYYLLNIDNKISPLAIRYYIRSSCVHLHNFNKQHLILAIFYANNAQSIGKKSAKFQSNLFSKQQLQRLL